VAFISYERIVCVDGWILVAVYFGRELLTTYLVQAQ
jgi:hypothetical protein